MASRSTISLVMIVKNEAPVIRRCLDSVRSLIDHWLIVDTGSTDGTQDIIRAHLVGVPGELVERPWVDFAHNRSEALALARTACDYALVIDADETLAVDRDFETPALTADSYMIEVQYGGLSYLRKAVVRSVLPWRYEGVLHEYMRCDIARTEGRLPGIRTLVHSDGARARDPLTYRRDALTLETALLADPNNARHVFYLAQSYRDARDPELALRHYRRRVDMGGWGEEVWYSLYQIAQLLEKLERPWPEVLEAYLRAYEYRPDRAGPLYRIAMHYQRRAEHATSHLFLARAMALPHPRDQRLFVERALYEVLVPLEYAVACFYLGNHEAAIETNNRLLLDGKAAGQTIARVIKNRRFSLDALWPAPAARATPGSIVVCVPYREIGHRLDDLVESLMRQTHTAFRAVFIADGTPSAIDARFPPGDARFAGVTGAEGKRWDECVATFAGGCPRGDVVVALTDADRFVDADALGRIHAAFTDPGCDVFYGQYRRDSGEAGDAMPPASSRVLETAGETLVARSAIAFRAGLAPQLANDATLAPVLLRSAGVARTRFSDDVITIDAAPRPGTSRRSPIALPASLAGRTDLPLVSCLMVTHDRLALAKRSILCFARQSYPRRELVIVSDGAAGYRAALARFVDEEGIADVRFVDVEPGAALGALRNRSLDAAAGDVFCQWDDDDCYHPERLALQLAYLLDRGARACFLTDHLQLLEAERVMVWVDWTLGGKYGRDQLLPGTVMAFRDDRFRYPETGPFARRGEDTMFLYALHDAVDVAVLRDMGHLYLYCFHGRNTFPKEHHHRLSKFSRSVAVIREREPLLRRATSEYAISRPLLVAGRDGPAFVISEPPDARAVTRPFSPSNEDRP